jgi:hypothetical protein
MPAPTTSGVNPAAAAAAGAGAAAATQKDQGEGLSSSEWGWICFGVLAAAVAIFGIVWWWRRRSGTGPPDQAVPSA